MIQEISQFQEINLRHIDPLFLDHFQFQEHMKFPSCHIVIANKKKQTKQYQAQDTMNLTKEDNLDVLTVHPTDQFVLYIHF